MPSEAIEQFLAQGQGSGLFSAAEAEGMLAQATSNPSLTTEQIAAQMIEKKILTPYQAEQLLVGRGEECLVAGRYTILDKLGAGGMGTVYKARDTKLDRLVALKVLPAQRLHDGDAIARFQREAKALARLSHPHIIQAYDSGEDKDRHFLIMEYVAGVTLEQVLRQRGALPPTMAADFIHQAALGLAHAHAKGLIHRDLKPGNLLVAGQPLLTTSLGTAMTVDYHAGHTSVGWKTGTAIVKVLDLGLARFLQDQLGDAHLTQEGIGIGTPDYMAPEQFRDAFRADIRTDIYGLGCTLYHLIAGQVPFPGSSYTEKAQAHAKKEPIPLEERCPELPGGLACVVAKMMAKHPDERFQTASEVTDALAPYVAGGSHSMIRLKQTGVWQRGQLTMHRPTGVKRVLGWTGGLAAAAILLAVLLFSWPRVFGPAPSTISGRDAQGSAPDAQPAEPPKPQVVTIDNGWTVAKDGTGQFTTIGEALLKVKPGQTIRVLDDGVYPETVQLRDRVRFAGLTLEAPRRATLEIPAQVKVGLIIMSVPRVTVRGFNLRGGATCAGIGGLSPGAFFAELHCTSSGTGLTLDNLALQAADPPIRVENCTFTGLGNGIEVIGVNLATRVSQPTARVIIRQNDISDCVVGLWATGRLNVLQIVGNRIWNCDQASLRLNDLHEGSARLLIANNSITANRNCVEITQSDTGVEDVNIRNNLLAAETGLDLARPGSTKPLPGSWQIAHNWRHVRRPAPDSADAKQWVDSPQDKFVDKLPVVSLDPRQPEFFRPAKDSPLAKSGAGGDLPTYVGAVPPEGVEPWDWQKTWESRHPKMLFTVSKDPKDGGEFRTINEALAKVTRPGQTIRVLDSATYQESVLITKRDKHEGLTLETPRAATLTAPAGAKIALLVRNVPRVKVRGFRLRTESQGVFLSGVVANCPGVVFDTLDFSSSSSLGTVGVTVEATSLASGDMPVIIENCTFSGLQYGIRVAGRNDDNTPAACRRLLTRRNKISECSVGIQAAGLLTEINIVANQIWGCETCDVELTNLFAGSAHILIANNSVRDPRQCLRISEPAQDLRDVEIRNNLILASPGPDVVASDKDQPAVKAWRFDHNWRQVRPTELSEPDTKQWVRGTDDTIVDRIELLSAEPKNSNFLRPAKNSPLAKAGAGGDLPEYVGAVPPEGVEPWDWDKTWKARTQKPAQPAKTDSKK